MGLLNSIFGNNELNDKIQELENSNLEMQKKQLLILKSKKLNWNHYSLQKCKI